MPKKTKTIINLWNEYQDTPWGRMSISISQENLQTHLPEYPCRILDIGGGNGRTAIAYAEKGHTVTLLDISGEMLSEAQQFARSAGVSERIEFTQADVMDLHSQYKEQLFDVILCHNVIGYLENVPAAIKLICECLKPGGILSLISVNPYSESYREILQQLNPEAALGKLNANTYTSQIFAKPIALYTAEEIAGLLQTEGCMVKGRYGVRCVIDYIQDNAIKEDPYFYAQLERLEKTMCRKYPYYLLARNYQILVQKV